MAFKEKMKKPRSYKYNKYKGVNMEFIDEDNKVYARAWGIGVVGVGKNKKEALKNAKEYITRAKDRGNIL